MKIPKGYRIVCTSYTDTNNKGKILWDYVIWHNGACIGYGSSPYSSDRSGAYTKGCKHLMDILKKKK